MHFAKKAKQDADHRPALSPDERAVADAHSAEAIEELRRKKAASIGADELSSCCALSSTLPKSQTLRQGTSIVPLGAISLENQCHDACLQLQSRRHYVLEPPVRLYVGGGLHSHIGAFPQSPKPGSGG